MGCSGTSRKTRIETESIKPECLFANGVAVELPEKQGLKLNLSNPNVSSPTVLQWNFQKNKD